MTRAELHQLIDRLPDEAVDATASLMKQLVDGKIDVDQLWFWTPEWQVREREVDESIARGEPGTVHMTDDAFLAALESRSKSS